MQQCNRRNDNGSGWRALVHVQSLIGCIQWSMSLLLTVASQSEQNDCKVTHPMTRSNNFQYHHHKNDISDNGAQLKIRLQVIGLHAIGG
jgi:hypothetical protein